MELSSVPENKLQLSSFLKDQQYTSPQDVAVEHIEVPGSKEPIQRYENIYLVPLFSKIDAPTLRTMVPDIAKDLHVIGLDFNVEGYQQGVEIRDQNGTLLGIRHPNDVINIDHHIPVSEMARPISTAPLVSMYVQEHGTVSDQTGIGIINHTDADSILSSLILAGKLNSTDSRFNQAAIDADHTGRENAIADLLVALEQKRDLQFSLYCLNKHLRGETLPEEAQQLVTQRQAQRAEVKQLVEQGLMKNMGQGVYLIESEKSLRSEFFPSAKEDASIFVVAVPSRDGWEYKVRAGNQLPEGKKLNQMDIPYFGGRWNAGGTKRQGVVPIPPHEYAEAIVAKLG